MANFTAMAIKSAFLKLLEEKPLSDITVKDIVETCGINRNSFYYHYSDIPSLIDQIVSETAEGIIRKYPTVTSMMDCIDAIIEFAGQNKKAVAHMFRSTNREVFEQHLMQTCEYFVRSYINTALIDAKITPEIREQMIGYYKCVCFGLAYDWLSTGMTDEKARIIRQIVAVRSDLIGEFAMKLLELPQ